MPLLVLVFRLCVTTMLQLLHVWCGRRSDFPDDLACSLNKRRRRRRIYAVCVCVDDALIRYLCFRRSRLYFLFLFLLSIAPALLRANVQSWQRCLTNAHTLAGSLARRVRVFDRIQMQLGRLFDWQFVCGARGINTSQNKHRKLRRFSFAYFTIRSSFDTLNVACFVWRISRICFGALRRITPVKHTLSLCKYQLFFPVLIPKSR